MAIGVSLPEGAKDDAPFGLGGDLVGDVLRRGADRLFLVLVAQHARGLASVVARVVEHDVAERE